MLVQLPSLARIGARILPRLELSDPEARKALLLMAPRALGLGATQVVFLVMTGLASTLAEGSIAVFNFAFAVLQIPIGVIGVPLGRGPAAVAVARGRDGRHGRVPAAARPRRSRCSAS